jgi:GNAT superfamily N-acetyltransferase
MARVVFISGPPASGKLTIAKELAKLTSHALFHNHLTVDLLTSVYPFGSEAFVRHRETIWHSVMADAVRTGGDILFTFAPERTVSQDFPQRLTQNIRAAGGTIVFVSVWCDPAERKRRISDRSRVGAKLSDPELYAKLEAEGAFDYPPIPSDLSVDSTKIHPLENARIIAGWLVSHPPEAGAKIGQEPAASPEAQALIAALDADILGRAPGMPVFGISGDKFEQDGGYFAVARDQGEAVACGAYRPLGEGIAEVKRMFVLPKARGRGLARAMLSHLESQIRARAFRTIVLETGPQHHEAISLYESAGYAPLPPYLDYTTNPGSRCFVKVL